MSMSMSMSMPATYVESGRARKATPAAISSGRAEGGGCGGSGGEFGVGGVHLGVHKPGLHDVDG